MLAQIASELDAWIAEQNLHARAEGLVPFEPCTIKVLGQSALLEAGVALQLASTKDVAVRADYSHAVKKAFEQLLQARGRCLDPVGHEAWMPRETRYLESFKGQFVRLLIAEPEAVLLSKALKAPAKNRALLTEYLAKGASERFLRLADKYQLDLEQFL